MNSIVIETIVKVLVTILGAAGGILAKKLLLGEKTRGMVRYLTWTARYTHPMISRFHNFKMIFDGEECESLCETRLVIWNESKKIVDAKDIAPASPIVWRPNSRHRVMTTRVIQQTHEGIGAVAHWDPDTKFLNIAFHYLEPTDGFVISILHTGPQLPFWEYAPGIQGSIKGFGKISGKLGDKVREGPHFPYTYVITPAWSRRLWLVLIGANIISMAYGGADLFLGQSSEFYQLRNLVPPLFIVVCLFAFLLSAFVAMWRAKPPSDLTKFFETWDVVDVSNVSGGTKQPLNPDRDPSSDRPPHSG